MKLIDEAIDLLGDSNEPLANAFFKAQIIAHKLKNLDFGNWVKNEIQGYNDDDVVPQYRRFNITPFGNVENIAKRYKNMRLPVAGIPDDLHKRFFIDIPFPQSIAVIEEFSSEERKITLPIDQRFYPFLRDGFDPSFAITNAWGVPPAGCFTQILHESRSRLLDLLLNLSEVIPAEVEGVSAMPMSKVEGLNDMFKGAVFGNGVNISLAIGENNQASHNSVSVTTNDIESLVSELKKNKVSEPDIEELKVAIHKDGDAAKLNGQGLGKRVRSWLGGMIAKAGTPAWEVPAQIGAGLLTGLITKYYGL